MLDAVGAGWYRDLRPRVLATLGCYLSPPNKHAQTSPQLKQVSTRSHSRLGEQETNEKDRAFGSTKPGYLANNRNRDLEEKLQEQGLGSAGDSASHGQSAFSGANQLVPSLL